VLAEWIEARAVPEQKAPSPEAVNKRAISLFDRLRLRSAFGESFAFIGVEGEDAWRAAARIRVAFLPAGPSLHNDLRNGVLDETSSWWADADVRWLTGLHETKGGWYFNKESYEQMVWWAALPELVQVEVDAAAEKTRLRNLAKKVESELFAAQNAKFRLGKLKPTVPAEQPEADISDAGESATKESLPPEIAIEEREVVILGSAPPVSSKE
jgi:hypothetical protein